MPFWAFWAHAFHTGLGTAGPPCADAAGASTSAAVAVSARRSDLRWTVDVCFMEARPCSQPRPRAVISRPTIARVIPGLAERSGLSRNGLRRPAVRNLQIEGQHPHPLVPSGPLVDLARRDVRSSSIRNDWRRDAGPVRDAQRRASVGAASANRWLLRHHGPGCSCPTPGGGYAGGLRQRLHFALSLLHDPELLVLVRTHGRR
jgi:hypothetical protein